MLSHYDPPPSILDVATLVRSGEFTTYSDISRVVYGHGRGGLAVGRMAMTNASFPNPHRVLAQGGLIPTKWAFRDGKGSSKDAERLLKNEGVEIIYNRHGHPKAHPRHYVDDEELIARLSQSHA
jgi:alkylated DNA nucleotide flippase Atl1